MTKDPNDTNDTPPPGDPDTPDGAPDAPPRAPRRGAVARIGRFVAWTLATVVLLVVLAVGLVLAAVTTEHGTRLAWQVAERVLGTRLAGTLDGGSLATGVRLRGFAWTSPDGTGTEIRIDRLDGRWALTRAPWRLSIAYLRAGTIDVRIPPGPSTPSTTPQDLSLPLQLRIDDLRVDRLAIHDGGSTTQLDHLALNGRSDGRHHELVLHGVDTPYGALTARAKLDGVKPFALTGRPLTQASCPTSRSMRALACRARSRRSSPKSTRAG